MHEYMHIQQNVSFGFLFHRIPPRFEASLVFDKWHVAFYGSQVGRIRRILDMGDLPVPSEICQVYSL